MYFLRPLVVVCALALLASGCSPSGPAVAADVIYVGGPIVTVNDAQPDAEALAVKDGTILAVGARAENREGPQGKVDADGGPRRQDADARIHRWPCPRPAVRRPGRRRQPARASGWRRQHHRRCRDQAEGLRRRAGHATRPAGSSASGYDDALLGRHPTREDLDKVSTTVPVMATHISGHFAAVNSLGLKMIGYDASTPNPEGGVIRREADGRTPNGVLEELAAIPHMLTALTPATPEGKDYFLKRGLDLAKSFGYTTANEGRMFGADACRSWRTRRSAALSTSISSAGWTTPAAANSTRVSARAIPTTTASAA